jgi:hypothetical protein
LLRENLCRIFNRELLTADARRFTQICTARFRCLFGDRDVTILLASDRSTLSASGSRSAGKPAIWGLKQFCLSLNKALFSEKLQLSAIDLNDYWPSLVEDDRIVSV